MCGRFQLEYEMQQLVLRFDAQNNYIGYGTRKEIFPTDMVAVIIKKEDQNVIVPAKWGLNSYYDKRPLINARGETVDEKKTFKKLFLENRCIIPATGFFEWKTESNKKTKFHICPKDKEVFGMAGLYKFYAGIDGEPIMHCAIITIAANEEMLSIHERMPVILSKEDETTWLNSSIKDPLFLKEFIKSYNGQLSFTAV